MFTRSHARRIRRTSRKRTKREVPMARIRVRTPAVGWRGGGRPAIAYRIFCYLCKPMQMSRWIEFPARRYRLFSLASHETRRSSSTGSCEAGLTPATLPAEPSRGPTTGMPCVKMPPRLCALKSYVYAPAHLVR